MASNPSETDSPSSTQSGEVIPDNPNSVGDPTPADRLSIEAIRAAVSSRAKAASDNLASLRRERASLNIRIKAAVLEEQEARRLAAALEPRAKKIS